jgi:hypothetical protein
VAKEGWVSRAVVPKTAKYSRKQLVREENTCSSMKAFAARPGILADSGKIFRPWIAVAWFDRFAYISRVRRAFQPDSED